MPELLLVSTFDELKEFHFSLWILLCTAVPTRTQIQSETDFHYSALINPFWIESIRNCSHNAITWLEYSSEVGYGLIHWKEVVITMLHVNFDVFIPFMSIYSLISTKCQIKDLILTLIYATCHATQETLGNSLSRQFNL